MKFQSLISFHGFESGAVNHFDDLLPRRIAHFKTTILALAEKFPFIEQDLLQSTIALNLHRDLFVHLERIEYPTADLFIKQNAAKSPVSLPI